MTGKGRKKESKAKYISISEAAKLFSVSRWTVRREINEFKIRERKEGRRTMVNQEELKLIFKPVKQIGNKKIYSIKQAAILNRAKPRIKLIIERSNIINIQTGNPIQIIKEFLKEDIKGQNKWRIKQRKIYNENQKLFKAGKTVNEAGKIIEDWGFFQCFIAPEQ